VSGRSPRDLAREVSDRERTVEVFDALLAASRLDEEEREQKRRLIAWFTRAYPTVEARLAYVRRHAKRATRAGAE
jgi:hypothetical protein